MRNNKIFISIPSWRDPFVKNTVFSAIDNAKSPENLSFGIVFQGYEEDSWMIDFIQNCSAEIRLLNVPAKESPLFITKIKGSMALSLLKDESYYFQVDSHNKFKKNWDYYLKAELDIATKNFGPSVINPQIQYFTRWDAEFSERNFTAIPSYEQFQSIGDLISPTKTPIAVNGAIYDKPNNTMILERFNNGNSMFAYSDFFKKVPYPPNYTLTHEQQIMHIRAFTAGYNSVSPINAYTQCFDYWTPEPKDDFIRNVRYHDNNFHMKYGNADRLSTERYEEVLSNRIIDEVDGLFSTRSYEEYVDFVGYDPITLQLTRPGKMLERNNFIIVSDQELEEAAESLHKGL